MALYERPLEDPLVEKLLVINCSIGSNGSSRTSVT